MCVCGRCALLGVHGVMTMVGETRNWECWETTRLGPRHASQDAF